MFETLGQYKILERIGAGGIGEVYRARDTRLGRTVAIRVVSADIAGDPARRERLLQDARAATALSHPNIATLYEAGEDHDQLFLAFEYAPGETLKRTIAGRPLNPRRAIDLGVQIADALADAHAAGIVHRDLSADNIVVTPKGNAKLLEVGLSAWTTSGAEREQVSRRATSAAAGPKADHATITYMSPEQALGSSVDHRTDIFSLGVVMYEMLTGKLPFIGATPGDLVQQVVGTSAPAPSTVNRSLPAELDPIVGKAMAKAIDQRYESAATLAAELRSVGAILDVRSDAQEAAATFASAPSGGRSIVGWLVLIALLAALGAAAWYERATLQKAWRRTLGPSPAPVIAIVPFDTDPSQTLFADGLAEDLTTRLGHTPGLKVVGRSSARQYRGRQPDEAARELGASVVLTGTLRGSGDAIRLSLRLIDPSDGNAIWSNDYARDGKDVFAMHQQVADDVSRALGVTVQPTPAAARAASRLVDPRAYEQYLRGRQAMAARQLPQAAAFYEQAVATDAGLGEAQAALAETLRLQSQLTTTVDDAAYRVRETAAAKRAYEVDPDLAAANVAMALVSDTLADSLKYLRRAIELDPSYGRAYHLVGDDLVDFDPEQAIVFYEKSLDLDPRQTESRREMADALERLGRHEQAQQLQSASVPRSDAGKSVERDQSFGDVHKAGSPGDPRPAGDKTTPEAAVAQVRRLRDANQADEALTEAAALAVRFPKDCEAKVVLAALRLEHRDRAAAHRLADGPLAAASLDSRAAAVRCGLHAAAALQSAGAGAAVLDRISASEPMLRAFASGADGPPGSTLVDRQTYPWSLIARDPVVVEARQRLDAAYAREREIARASLKGLP